MCRLRAASGSACPIYSAVSYLRSCLNKTDATLGKIAGGHGKSNLWVQRLDILVQYLIMSVRRFVCFGHVFICDGVTLLLVLNRLLS